MTEDKLEVEEVKKIDIKEFREEGYLQELNRRFLHPLGLALAVDVDEEDPNAPEELAYIWDYRDDPDGIHFDWEDWASDEEIEHTREKSRNISHLEAERHSKRLSELGYWIEPVPKYKHG